MRASTLDKAILALEQEQASLQRAIELLKIQRTALATMSRGPKLVVRVTS